MASVQNFAVTAGEDQTLTMTARDGTGAVIDLTSAGITWRVMGKSGGTVLSKTGTALVAASGTFTVSLTDADTSGFKDGNYTHEALVTVSGVTTKGVSGRLRVSGQKAQLGVTSVSVIETTVSNYDTVSGVTAATIRSDVSWIRTAGYYAAGDGGGALYKRAGTQPSHIGYITSNSGATYWELEENSEPNVRQFGAKGDGSTDDTTYVNGIVNYLRAKVSEGNETAGSYTLVFPKGDYLVTSSIDLTDIRTRLWGLRGPGKIIGQFNTAYPILDFTNSRWAKVEDLFVTGQSGYTPGIGVFIGRDDSGAVADCINFDNVDIYGTFTLSAFYNYGSEDFTSHRLTVANLSSSASTYCAVFTGDNSLGATSAFATIPASTSVSFNDSYCQCLDARKPNGGPAIHIRRSAGFEVRSGYAVSSNDAAIVVSSDSFGQQNLWLDIHCETTGLTSCVRFDGVASQTIKGFRFSDYAPQASTQIFEAGSGVTSVILRDVVIDIPTYGVTPSNGLYSSASVFTVYEGNVYTPTVTTRRSEGHPGWVSGRYYYYVAGTTASAITTVENRMYFYPLFVPGARSIDRIGVFITSAAGDATNQFRLAIYKNGDGIPGTLILDAGTVTVGTGTGQQTITISQELPSGWVWLAAIGNKNGGVGVMANLRNFANDAANTLGYLHGDVDLELNTPGNLIFADPTVSSWASYTFPTTAPAVTYSAAGVSPLIGVRAA